MYLICSACCFLQGVFPACLIHIKQCDVEWEGYVPCFIINCQCFNPCPAGTECDLAYATSIKPGQPAHPCSLTRLYTVG